MTKEQKELIKDYKSHKTLLFPLTFENVDKLLEALEDEHTHERNFAKDYGYKLGLSVCPYENITRQIVILSELVAYTPKDKIDSDTADLASHLLAQREDHEAFHIMKRLEAENFRLRKELSNPPKNDN